jgi:hypothetical protein
MRNWLAIVLFVLSALLVAAATALAEVPPEPAPVAAASDPGLEGLCMGIATRCGLLPKGSCFMQAGCVNPALGDRCAGVARLCPHFKTKSSCFGQRGCTWVKPTKKERSQPSTSDSTRR